MLWKPRISSHHPSLNSQNRPWSTVKNRLDPLVRSRSFRSETKAESWEGKSWWLAKTTIFGRKEVKTQGPFLETTTYTHPKFFGTTKGNEGLVVADVTVTGFHGEKNHHPLVWPGNFTQIVWCQVYSCPLECKFSPKKTSFMLYVMYIYIYIDDIYIHMYRFGAS